MEIGLGMGIGIGIGIGIGTGLGIGAGVGLGLGFAPPLGVEDSPEQVDGGNGQLHVPLLRRGDTREMHGRCTADTRQI